MCLMGNDCLLSSVLLLSHLYTICADKQIQRNTEKPTTFISEEVGHGAEEQKTRAEEVLCLVSRVCRPANGQPATLPEWVPTPLATHTLQRVVMGDPVKPP